MGNNRHPTAESQNERRRSANMARADASAHRQRLAHLPDRKTHAVELQGLNGLCLALTYKSFGVIGALDDFGFEIGEDFRQGLLEFRSLIAAVGNQRDQASSIAN